MDTKKFLQNLHIVLENNCDDKLKIIDYSNKCIVVFGNTDSCKNILLYFDGRYNANLKINNIITPGWIFPITKIS